MHKHIAALLLLLSALVAAQYLGQTLTPPAPGTITLALMGDVMLGRGVAQAHDGGTWSAALADLTPTLQSADLTLANLESPLAREVPTSVAQAVAAGEYNLCAPAISAYALTSAGLDVLSLANNHADDCGAGGLDESRSILYQAGLTPLLPGEPLHLTINSIQLILLAYDDISHPLDIETAAAQVRAARLEGAMVLVSIHWGAEYHPGPSRRQQAIALVLIKAGASILLGHHPHVLQPVELDQDGAFGPTLVAYSLGNALFDQVSPPDARRSAVLLVTLDAHGVQDVQIVPIQIDPLAGAAHLAEGAAGEVVLNRLGVK